MTDKEELLKAIEQKRQEIWPTDTHEMAPATVPNNLEQGWLNALTWMENLINSLPAEPSEEVEENIEGKINEYWNEWFSHGEYFEGTLPKNVFAAYCHKIANWQKEKTINKASQWLNENVVEYHPRKGELRPIVNINAFRDAMEKEDEQCSTE